MSRDYFVVWTQDCPTPASLGLGGELMQWPSSDRPWPRTNEERSMLGYPEGPHRGHDSHIAHGVTEPPEGLPGVVLAALSGRKVVRSFTIQNDSDLAVVLAEAGEGVCWDEEDELLHPLGFDSEDGDEDSDESDDAADASAPARDPEDARKRASAMVWVSMNPRPATTCGPIVTAAANGDPRAVAVLRAWAPSPYGRPNLGVRKMGHDRELCELVFEAAKRRPSGLADLIRVLEVHGYYPAARRPELAALAKEANVDVSFFVAQARKDAAERRKWFQVEEPLD